MPGDIITPPGSIDVTDLFAAPSTPSPLYAPMGPEEADGVWSALSAGWQSSTGGLLKRMKAPEVVLDEDADLAERISFMLARTVGDMPTLVAGYSSGAALAAPTGAAVGAAVGSVVPGPGTAIGAVTGGVGAAVIGGAAGALALTEGMRAWLMQQYEDPATAGTALERLAISLGAAGKGGLIGIATAGAGRFVGGTAAVQAMPAIARHASITAGELASMVTVAKALEGELPTQEDFIDGAILLGGLKAAAPAARGLNKTVKKLKDRYVKTGEIPATVAAEALVNANLRAGLLSEKDASIARDIIGQTIKKSKKGKSFWQDSYTAMVDDLNPINRLVQRSGGREGLPAELDPYKIARTARGIQGAAAQRLETLTKSLDELVPRVAKKKATLAEKEAALENALAEAEKISLGLRGKGRGPHKIAAIDRAYDRLTGEQKGLKRANAKQRQKFRDDLKEYLIAARILELEGRGIQSGAKASGIVKSTRIKAKAPEAIKTAAEKVYKFKNDMVTEAVESGLIAKATAKEMFRLNKYHIPFRRLFEDEGGAIGPKGSKRPFSKIKGSERKIMDPYEAIVDNTISLMKAIEQNKVNRAMVALESFAKVKAPMVPTKLSKAEMNKVASELGVLPEAGAKMPEMTIFRPARTQLTDSQIGVWVKGKQQVYEVGTDLAAAARALDPYLAGPWMRALSYPATMLRALTVISPDFIIRNFQRDQLTAGVYSRTGFVPFLDFAKGLMSYIKQDQYYEQWRLAGGENTALLAVDRLIGDVFSVKQPNPWNSKLNPYIMLRTMSESVENATRIAEFKRSVGTGLSKKEAAFRSREITLDFARKGQTAARAANQLIAFFNVQIQGIDRFTRAIKDNPSGALARTAVMVTMPSIVLWMFNHDKQWYQEIPQWEKDLYWVFSPDDGETVYRLPKPFEIGILFGSIPERILDAMYVQNSAGMEGVVESMWQNFIPDFMPTFAAPFSEAINNKSILTGNAIVRRDIEDLLPPYQYTEYTSPVAKYLGELVGYTPLKDTKFASPAVIENFWGSWTGSTGRAVIDAADLAIGKYTGQDPSPTLSDIPYIKAFVVRQPSGGAASIGRFLDQYQKFKSVKRTLDVMLKRGDSAAATRIMTQYGDKLVNLQATSKAIADMRRLTRQIWTAPADAIAPDEKRQMIDSLYYQMIAVARFGLDITSEIKRLKDEGAFDGIIELGE